MASSKPQRSVIFLSTLSLIIFMVSSPDTRHSSYCLYSTSSTSGTTVQKPSGRAGVARSTIHLRRIFFCRLQMATNLTAQSVLLQRRTVTERNFTHNLSTLFWSASDCLPRFICIWSGCWLHRASTIRNIFTPHTLIKRSQIHIHSFQMLLLPKQLAHFIRKFPLHGGSARE